MWAGAQVVLTMFVNTFGAVAFEFNVQEDGIGRVGGGALGLFGGVDGRYR